MSFGDNREKGMLRIKLMQQTKRAEKAEQERDRLAEALAASEAKVAKFDNILDQYTDGKISKVACVSLMLNAADS